MVLFCSSNYTDIKAVAQLCLLVTSFYDTQKISLQDKHFEINARKRKN